jgi:hypothetical protein
LKPAAFFRAPDAEVSTRGVAQVKYLDGQEVRLGDRERVGHDPSGLVVACIETQEYSPEFPKAEWEYLQRGFLVKSSKYGLVHHERPDEDMELIERKAEC